MAQGGGATISGASSHEGSQSSFDGSAECSFDGDDTWKPKRSSNMEYGAATAEQAIDVMLP